MNREVIKFRNRKNGHVQLLKYKNEKLIYCRSFTMQFHLDQLPLEPIK